MAFLVLSSTGCGILGVLALPFQLLFQVIGGVFDVVGKGVDAVVMVEPVEGPAPTVRLSDANTVVVADVVHGARFRVTFDADGEGGAEPTVFSWPEQAPLGWEAAARSTGSVRIPLTLPAAPGSTNGGAGTW